jgi:hypothetical protein
LTFCAIDIRQHRDELALNRMDWASVESSRKSTPLWAHEIAPGLATR